MGSARITIYEPASVGLSQFGMTRLRPAGLRDDTPPFHRFDSETMFFDVFRAGENIICLGPPLDGMVPTGLRLSIPHSRSALAQRLEPPRIVQQHSSRLTLSGPELDKVDTLTLEAGGHGLPVAVRQSESSLLAGRRVVMTLQRDNPLPWIRDWAAFHVRLHGADAVLLYDNGSQAYGTDEIAAALSEIAGLQQVVIVSWPFPYGVGGRPGEPSLDNFCQTGAFDHARRCFCTHARSVLNLDIDELLPPGTMPIFEQVETGPHAVLLFRGVWAEAPGIDNVEAAQRLRHRDCSFVWREQMEVLAAGKAETLCRTKWIAVPARCHADLEWGIHDVYPATGEAHDLQRGWRGLDRSIAYRHCRQINTGWKTDRWRSSADFDSVCRPDPEMAAAYARAFD